MAEFLCLARDHRYSTKPADWTQEDFDRRFRIGDVIEIRPDGYFRIEYLGEGTHGWNRDAFFVTRIPWVNSSEIQQIRKAWRDGLPTQPQDTVKKIRNRRYHIDWTYIQTYINSETIMVNSKSFTERWLDIPTSTSVSNVKVIDKVDDSEVIFI